MALFYNKVFRKNPNEPTSPGKWYVVLRSLGQTSEKDVAKFVADETTLNPKEAEMAIYQLLKVLQNELLNGKTVQLGELGSFFLTVTGDGVDDENEVSAKLIKSVNLKFRTTKVMREALAKAEFKQASSLSKKK